MSSKKIEQPIGIYDPEGLNVNPFTNKPYANLYSHIQKNIDGETLPATYANLAKIWKTKLVYLHKDNILNSIQNNQITLAKAGTGVGKTVLIPKIALHAFNYKEKVLCTIPKKVITRSTAEFAAQCLDVKVGEEVGYYFKGENKTSDKTKLIFTTTGSVISKITGSDPYLDEYKCIIIDEAHERSVQTDQLLLLLKKAMTKRKDLKLVIMSATINLEVFRNYYPKPFKFGEVDAGEMTSYKIQDYWLNKQPKPNEWKELAIKRIINILQTSEDGDILVFIRASSDGKSLCDSLHREVSKLRRSNNITFNPFCTILAGKSTKEDENLATDETKYLELKNERGSKYTRKVVMATNVAESSLTVDGVVYVIDCGLEYEDSYEPSTMSRCLSEEPIPLSGVKQRRGRAGRTKPGVCFHLYTQQYQKSLQKYPTPSIQKSDITSDMLDLFRLEYINNVKDLKGFLNEFISPPKKIFIDSSLKTLHALNCITSIKDDGTITDLGYGVAKFRGLKPQLAKAIIASYYYKCSRSVCDIVALLINADGMINTIFNDFREDKKKNPKINAQKKQKFLHSRKLFTHQYGDAFSLFKAFTLFREKDGEFKHAKELSAKRKENEIQLKDEENDPKYIKQLDEEVSLLDQIKKDNTVRIKNPSQNKLKKSIKLLKMLNVDKSIIKSLKDNEKSKKKKIVGGASRKKHSIKKTKKSFTKKSKRTSSKKKQSINIKSISSMKKEKVEENRNVRKWCNNNFINYNKLVMAKRMSQQLHRTLLDVMRSTDLKKGRVFEKKKSKSKSKSSKKYKTNNTKDIVGGGKRYSPLHKFFHFDIDYNVVVDDRIMLSLLQGMFINIANLTHSSKKIYTPCFPIKKIDAKINMDSLLKTNSKFVFYEELFMFNKSSKVLKLNMCNQIPFHMIEDIKELYKDYMIKCFIEKKMISSKGDSFMNFKRGKHKDKHRNKHKGRRRTRKLKRKKHKYSKKKRYYRKK